MQDANQTDPVAGEAAPHEALLYRAQEGFLQGTLPYIRAGIRSAEPVVVAVAQEKIAALKSALGEDQDRVTFFDMSRLGANPARIIPAYLRFIALNGGGGRRLRGVGEPVWAGRPVAELDECRRHEALLNLVIARHPELRFLCPYDLEQLAPDEFNVAARTHPFMRGSDGGRQPSSEYPGLTSVGWPFGGGLPPPESEVEERGFGPGEVREVRAFAAAGAARAGLPAARRADLEWAVAELAENSLRHGGGRGRVRLWCEGGQIVCEVQDQGRIDNPLAGREPPLSGDGVGRGLWLVNQLCDLVRIRRDERGTTVRVHLRRDATGREVGLVPLLGDQLLAALDRLNWAVWGRLSKSDRSLLLSLPQLAEAALMGVGPVEAGPHPDGTAGEKGARMPEGAVRELLSAGLVLVREDGRLFLTEHGRRIRRTILEERRRVAQAWLERVPGEQLRQLLSAVGAG
ncbi:MAG: anti-sigma factor RsbA family regulatory protein [Candidatus Dormibacteria bacterium]